MAKRKKDDDLNLGGGNPGNLTGEGSGQQTAGRRGKRMNIKRKENYQQSGQKKKIRTKGGNH